jgi:hypothetical protein
MMAIKVAEQSKVFQACAPKRAKTTGEEEDDLQNVCSEFMADLDNFGSLRSKTPFNDR